ncbi:hypothetical protein A3C37_03500 [Candidatus Peribacteria bacterium RIFCSPHIGHO2_02_FULL_53_20]|nr:MAG: hypothetical protein A3C37_03500 [Candidatus Peribacteria bacterium RIFCSPHIGHO2_02_FULL_53_20]
MLTLDTQSADGRRTASSLRDPRMDWNEVVDLLPYVQELGFATSADFAIAAGAALHAKQASHEQNGAGHIVCNVIDTIWQIAEQIDRKLRAAREHWTVHLADELEVLDHSASHARRVIRDIAPRVREQPAAPGRYRNGDTRHGLQDQLRTLQLHLETLEERMHSDESAFMGVERAPVSALLPSHKIAEVCRKIREAMLSLITGIAVPQAVSREANITQDRSLAALFAETRNQTPQSRQCSILRDGFTDDAYLRRLWGESPSPQVVSMVTRAAHHIDRGARRAFEEPGNAPDLKAWVAEQMEHSYGTDMSHNERMSLELVGEGLQRKDGGIVSGAEAAYWVNRGMGSPHCEVMDHALSASRRTLEEMNGAMSVQALRQWVQNRISYLAPKRQTAKQYTPLP